MPATPRTTPSRKPERVRGDRDLVHRILDEALVSHVGFTADGAPRVLPTLHVRDGDTLYLHGSTGSYPMLKARPGGLPICVAVTLVDGLVLSKSQFNHSVNYRSVVVHGTAHLVTDPAEKRRVLTGLVEHVIAGRASDSRPPTDKELAQTAVLAVPLTESTAKVRAGGVGEDPADLDQPYWSGVLPVRLVAGVPEPDETGTTPPLPGYLHGYHREHDTRSTWHQAPVLTGDLVRLAPLETDHSDDLFDAGRDPEVWRWLGSPRPADRDEMRDLIVEALQARAIGHRIPWALIDPATGRAIGTTSYYEIDPIHRGVAIGHTWLGRDWWRTGVNTEAKVLLLDRAFGVLEAHRVVWHTDSRNTGSQHAIERLGATREAVLRRHRYAGDGVLRDTVQYVMFAEEWPAARQRLRDRLDAAACTAPPTPRAVPSGSELHHEIVATEV
ncbi:MAG: bifunctional pyridoxamine 5'-phosphate oxidase family protein/GNAT family N-acetyltransferase [Micromonosporaceae bacterium]